jgi:CRISPR-associated protein Csx17
VNLLSDVDRWLDIFTGKATSDKAPASAGRALRQLNEAILTLCRNREPARVQEVLIALGECEKVLAKSPKWAKDKFVAPIPLLSKNWLKEADDGSPEFRLASSLASVYGQYRNREGQKFWMSIRTQMEPIRTWLKEGRFEVGWNDEGIVDVVWSDGDQIRALNAVMSRRIIRAVQSGADAYPDKGRINAELGDIADFIEGRVDLQRMASLLWGLMLLDWPKVTENALTRTCRSDAIFPGAGYGLMKLCFSGREVKGVRVPIVPEIHRIAALGDGAGATQLAVRRLRGSGLSVPVDKISLSRGSAQRTAAALIFPVDDYQLSRLADKVLRRGVEYDEKEV